MKSKVLRWPKQLEGLPVHFSPLCAYKCCLQPSLLGDYFFPLPAPILPTSVLSSVCEFLLSSMASVLGFRVLKNPTVTLKWGYHRVSWTEQWFMKFVFQNETSIHGSVPCFSLPLPLQRTEWGEGQTLRLKRKSKIPTLRDHSWGGQNHVCSDHRSVSHGGCCVGCACYILGSGSSLWQTFR
jgi:hypothetical protein